MWYHLHILLPPILYLCFHHVYCGGVTSSPVLSTFLRLTKVWIPDVTAYQKYLRNFFKKIEVPRPWPWRFWLSRYVTCSGSCVYYKRPRNSGTVNTSPAVGALNCCTESVHVLDRAWAGAQWVHSRSHGQVNHPVLERTATLPCSDPLGRIADYDLLWNNCYYLLRKAGYS